MKVRTLDEYFSKAASLSSSHKTTWYRGQLASHDLLPSLYRKAGFATAKDALETESRLCVRFKELADIHFKNGVRDDIPGLMQMQHYRMPTRLLDWTTNPLTGLFFALTCPAAADGKEDAVVFLLDPAEWNEKAIPSTGRVSGPFAPDDIDIWGYRPVKVEAKVSMMRHPVAIRGHNDTGRIAAQQGSFVLFANSLDKMDQHALSLGVAPSTLEQIEIPASDAPGMLDALLRMGITDDYVYPDLEGIVKHLRREEGYPV